MSSSQLAIVQTYKVQTNGNSTASKAKKPSHGSHSISVYCNDTSANYCNIFAYLRITYNTSGACLNLPEKVKEEEKAPPSFRTRLLNCLPSLQMEFLY